MKILVIAFNTFKEIIRDRVLYNIIIFSLLIIFSAVLLGRLSIGEHSKIVEDIGLSAIEIFALLISIFIGITLVYKEIDKKTIYTILAKPVKRYQFILGKFIGLVAIILVNIVVMSTVLMVISWSISGIFKFQLLQAVFLIFFEMIIITAVAILFSSFTTPFLSTLFTLAIFIIGTATTDIKNLSKKASLPLRILAETLYYILPNLDNFDVKMQAVYGQNINSSFLIWSVCYALLYSVLIVSLAIVIFEKRDFK
ncbi:MAG: hypothetical protein D6734_02655 [Candidatus Schekmanbacteria bacterium]|nr:MAG: hypothetical protein D6734_02655 [Candidatus Schekmanbacteria bacterium]